MTELERSREHDLTHVIALALLRAKLEEAEWWHVRLAADEPANGYYEHVEALQAKLKELEGGG